MTIEYKLAVIGCGTMGVAVLSGVLDSLRPNNSSSNPRSPALIQSSSSSSGTSTPLEESAIPISFTATVARTESARRLRKELGSQVSVEAGRNVDAVRESDVVLLCSKPQLAGPILTEPGMAEALEGKLLISILGGQTISALRAFVPQSTNVVRAMPNVPAKIREGMTVLSTLPLPSLDPTNSSPRTRAILLSLFTPIGLCRFLDEKYFDACTALSGSGPAFACVMLEAMADGGVMMGLPRREALELAAQTMQGAARMVLQSHSHPAQIKDSVTTPGGCTIAGLLTLEDGRVRSTIARSIQVATQRASELGRPVGGAPTQVQTQTQQGQGQGQGQGATQLLSREGSRNGEER